MALTISEVGVETPGESPVVQRRAWRRFIKNRLAVGGLLLVILFIVVALAAPVIAPYKPDATNFSIAFQASSAHHLLGTDDLGRDVLSRIIYGARGSLLSAVLIVLLGLVVGVPLGLVSGYYGGLVDDAIMRLTDAGMAFPGLVLAIALAWVLGPSLFHAILALGVVTISQFARVTRGQVLEVKSRPYVGASQCLGASSLRVMFRHILVNAATPIIAVATLSIGGALLNVASLSFLGLGPPPPTPNWGEMLQTGSQYLTNAPWMSLFPGAAIFLAVLGFNTFGGGIRDIFDPNQV